MASVKSPIRDFLKPLIFKLMPGSIYKKMQVEAKIKDIKGKFVEEPEMPLLPSLIKTGDVTIDIGANYAYFIERFSKLVGPSGKVIAFEPISFTHDICKQIVRKLKLNNVELHKKGVGLKTETVSFRIPKQDFGAISGGQSHMASRKNDFEGNEKVYNFSQEDYEDCQVVSLDEFLFSKLNKVDFIKIDIEGAEFFAIQGMQNLINKFRPVILIELTDYFLDGMGIKKDDIYQLLQNINYDLYHYISDSNKLTLTNRTEWDGNYYLLPKDKIETFSQVIE